MEGDRPSLNSSELLQQERQAVGLVGMVARSVFFCGARQGLLSAPASDRLRKDQLAPFLRCSKRYLDDLTRLSRELGEERAG